MKTAKQTNQDRLKEIKRLLKRIENKSTNFTKGNLNAWYGDLGSVLEDLTNIDNFISDKYLKA